MGTSTYIGKLIDNRYQINGRVGSGGSARVYRAHDTLMGRTVALKILEADETRYRINSRSFETEVEAISKLSHPNEAMPRNDDEEFPLGMMPMLPLGNTGL